MQEDTAYFFSQSNRLLCICVDYVYVPSMYAFMSGCPLNVCPVSLLRHFGCVDTTFTPIS